MRHFARPEFGVDIYKLEPPAVLRGVPDPDGPQAAAVQAVYDQLGALTTRPWVLLSAAAGPDDFRRSLTYAYRAGASGYLCGRAIWQSAFERFPDMAAMERELDATSAPYVRGLNELTDRLATPWPRHPAWQDGVVMAGDGPDFAGQYARG
jgi:tagatose 1,6-diphosphate aldolase